MRTAILILATTCAALLGAPRHKLEVLGGRVVFSPADGSGVLCTRVVVFNGGEGPARFTFSRQFSSGVQTPGFVEGGERIDPGKMATLLVEIDPKVFLKSGEITVEVPTSLGALEIPVVGSISTRIVPEGIPGTVMATVEPSGEVSRKTSSVACFRVEKTSGRVARWWVSSGAPIVIESVMETEGGWLVQVSPAYFAGRPEKASGVANLFIQTESGETAFVAVPWRYFLASSGA